MGANQKILDAVKWVAGTGGVIGMLILLISFFVSDYNRDYMLTAVGMAITLSAAAIFLVGVFFVLTEEMVMNTKKGNRIVSDTAKVVNIKTKKKPKRRRASI